VHTVEVKRSFVHRKANSSQDTSFSPSYNKKRTFLCKISQYLYLAVTMIVINPTTYRHIFFLKSFEHFSSSSLDFITMWRLRYIKTVSTSCWVWCHTPVIPGPGRLMQEDHEFKASLDYTVRPCLKKQKRKLNNFPTFVAI
jgi:hypothetical protein